MPYKIYKNKDKTYRVVNTRTKKITAKNSTLENALKQIRLLHMFESKNKSKNNDKTKKNKTKKNKTTKNKK